MSSGSTVIIRDKKGKIHTFFPMASSFSSVLLSYKYYEKNNDKLIIDYFNKLDFQHDELCPDDFYGITFLDFKKGLSLEANRAGSLTTMSVAGIYLFLKGSSLGSWDDIFDDILFEDLSQIESFEKIIKKNKFSLEKSNGQINDLPFNSNSLENWTEYFSKRNLSNKDYALVFNSPLKNICHHFNRNNLQLILQYILDQKISISNKEIEKWNKIIDEL